MVGKESKPSKVGPALHKSQRSKTSLQGSVGLGEREGDVRDAGPYISTRDARNARAIVHAAVRARDSWSSWVPKRVHRSRLVWSFRSPRWCFDAGGTAPYNSCSLRV